MAPIHHHFELQAWSETKIILRFWIITAVCAAIGFTLYHHAVERDTPIDEVLLHERTPLDEGRGEVDKKPVTELSLRQLAPASTFAPPVS